MRVPAMFAGYVRLIVFAIGLLVGVQIPNFVDQYAKRVSAHQIEVAGNFKGFQETADRYFGGSVDALIAHHAASTDQVFQDEAKTIREMYGRLLALSAELAALRGPLIAQIFHVIFRPNREIFNETRSAYSYTVPLDSSGIISGVTLGACLAILVESSMLGVVRLIRPRRTRRPDRAVETLAGLSRRHTRGIKPNDFLGFIPSGGQSGQVHRADRAAARIRLEHICTSGETVSVEIRAGAFYRMCDLADVARLCRRQQLHLSRHGFDEDGDQFRQKRRIIADQAREVFDVPDRHGRRVSGRGAARRRGPKSAARCRSKVRSSTARK